MVVKEVVEGLRLILRRGRSYISSRVNYIEEVGAFLTYLSNPSTILSS
jgi:hypothetical protein